MAQTTEGALKIRAAKAGVSVEVYVSLRDRGLKHCYRCQQWRPMADFNTDRTRYDGLNPVCRPCLTGAPSVIEVGPENLKVAIAAQKGRKIREAFSRRGPFTPPMKGKKMSAESRRKMSEKRKGRPGPWKGKKLSLEVRRKISKKTKANTPRGEKHYAYSHGQAQRNLTVRRSAEYQKWRDDVYRRDHYTCQHCGDDRGGNLHAHHIEPVAKRPDLALVIENGITLCRDCHEKIHLKPIPSRMDLRRRKKHRAAAALPLFPDLE